MMMSRLRSAYPSSGASLRSPRIAVSSTGVLLRTIPPPDAPRRAPGGARWDLVRPDVSIRYIDRLGRPDVSCNPDRTVTRVAGHVKNPRRRRDARANQWRTIPLTVR